MSIIHLENHANGHPVDSTSRPWHRCLSLERSSSYANSSRAHPSRLCSCWTSRYASDSATIIRSNENRLFPIPDDRRTDIDRCEHFKSDQIRYTRHPSCGSIIARSPSRPFSEIALDTVDIAAMCALTNIDTADLLAGSNIDSIDLSISLQRHTLYM